jgi:hypothetical protein
MPASYPGTVKVFATHVNITESIDASHPNDLQTEVVAIETTLGLNPALSTSPSPAGVFNPTSAQYATISARLANIEQGLVTDSHSQYLHLVGGDTITIATSNRIGMAIKSAASQTADPFQIFDSTPTKKVWVDSSYKLNVAGGITAAAGGAVIVGDSSVAGVLSTQKVAVTVPSAGAVGAVIKLAATPTADALQVQDSTGVVLYRVSAAGTVTGGTSSPTALTLAGGATDATSDLFGPPASYYKDAVGVTHLRGALKVGNSALSFNLATGLPAPLNGNVRFKPHMWRAAMAAYSTPANTVALTFAGSWGAPSTAFEQPYYIIDFYSGTVHLGGMIYGNGTASVSGGSIIATQLPTPAGNALFNASSTNGGGLRALSLATSGYLTVNGSGFTNTEFISLNGISYQYNSTIGGGPTINPYTLTINTSGAMGWTQFSDGPNNPVYISLDGISYYTG